MKFNAFIKNLSPYDLSMKMNKLLSRFPKKDRAINLFKLQRILLIKQYQIKKFTELLFASDYGRLAAMQSLRSKGFRKLIFSKQWKIFWNNFTRIADYCEIHKIKVDEWLVYYRSYLKGIK